VWIATFRHIDTLFVENKMTYLQFSELTKTVTAHLADSLNQHPLSVDELAQMLKASAVFGNKKGNRKSGGVSVSSRARHEREGSTGAAITKGPMSGSVLSVPAAATIGEGRRAVDSGGPGSATGVAGVSPVPGKGQPPPKPVLRNNRGTKVR
jgi:hypothetical protein